MDERGKRKGFSILSVKPDYAPNQMYRMVVAWYEWKIPKEQQEQWRQEIHEVFDGRSS